jgi:hypothetical protein
MPQKSVSPSAEIPVTSSEAEMTIREAWAVRNVAEQSQERQKGITEACNIVTKKIPPIMKEIEQLVQKRLCFNEA